MLQELILKCKRNIEIHVHYPLAASERLVKGGDEYNVALSSSRENKPVVYKWTPHFFLMARAMAHQEKYLGRSCFFVIEIGQIIMHNDHFQQPKIPRYTLDFNIVLD